MTHPWDAPPWAEYGDPDADTLYKAVGKALTSWELVEEVMARLFALFTSTTHQYPHSAPAIRAYGSVISFKGRSDMVKEAGKCFFHGYQNDRACPIESDFQPFLTECNGWAGRRNDVAHGRVGQLPNGYFLVPGLYNTKKQPLGEDAAYCYNSGQLATFAVAFEDLYDRVSEYATQLDGWLYTLLQSTLAQHPENSPDRGSQQEAT
jgi:hypothetical protein